MDDIITRIVELEQACAARVQGAEQQSREKLAAHEHRLAEQKTAEQARIASAAKAELDRAVAAAEQRARALGEQTRQAQARRYEDPALAARIQETIVALLLAR